ncbi:MAG: DUF3467 domain-containing protein [Ilumatobacteraceae bacterium]
MRIHTQADQMGGVWANAAAVRHSPHEFTIDFLRCDFDDEGKAKAGTLVQRVNMSPLFVTQLITALQDNWSKYADKAMPKEMGDIFLTPPTIENPDMPSDDDD